jgi:ATP-dependent Clp protease ATP-binding subunit ClpA
VTVSRAPNAAHEKLGPIAQRYQDEPDHLIRATKDALRDYFAPEFLARIDLVTSLAPLDDAGRARIIALHAGRIGGTYGVEVDSLDASFVSEGLRRWATLEGYGTREVIRWIEEVTADHLIEARSRGLTKVGLAWSDGQVEVTRP